MSIDHIDELQDGIEYFKNVIKQYKNQENIEIELRIGQINDTFFKSGLNSVEFYNKIRERLESSKDWDNILRTTTDELNSNGIRKITHFNGKKISKTSCITKKKLKNINLKYDNTPYDIRISVSREVESESKIKSGTLRKKTRDSYFYKDYRFDLTKVLQTENTVVSELYEFEVELINLDSDVSDQYRSHSALLIMRDIINMCEPIDKGKLEIDINEDLNKLNI